MENELRIDFRAADARATPGGRIVEAALLAGDSGVGRARPRHYAHRALVLLVRGGGFYRDTGGRSLNVAAGDLIFVEPRVGHAYGPGPGGRWEEFYVAHEGPVFDALAERGAPSAERPVLRLGDPAPWRRRLESVFPAKGPAVAERQLGALVEFILAAHAAAAPARDEERAPPAWLAKARQLLEAPGSEETDVAAVARACGLEPESFRKRFTALTGEPPARHRLLARVEQAKRLLRDRELPVRVVAEATGFCDEFHFSKTFKRVVGAGPREWRGRATGEDRGGK